MNTELKRFIDEFRATGKTYVFSEIVACAQQQNMKLSKDGLLEAHSRNYRSGIFYTPNAIAKSMADVEQIFGPERIVNPACGTGNILRYCAYGEEICGYDINSRVMSIAKWSVDKDDYYLEDLLSKDFCNLHYLATGPCVQILIITSCSTRR